MDSPKQWQCPECQQWVDAGYSMHVHDKTQEPSLDEMIANRRLGEMNIPAPDPLAVTAVERTVYWRTWKEPTREKPL